MASVASFSLVSFSPEVGNDGRGCFPINIIPNLPRAGLGIQKCTILQVGRKAVTPKIEIVKGMLFQD
jgi:hypothetical protein